MTRLGMSITASHPTSPSIEAQIALYAKVGFDSFFLATGVTEEYDKIPHWSAYAQSCGIQMEGVHGPTGGANALWAGKTDGYYHAICKIIDYCKDGQVDKLILHGAHGTPPPVSDVGLSAVAKLEDYAASAGVRLCWENSNVPAHFLALADRPHMGQFHGICLDAGHHQCYTPDLDWQTPLHGKILYTHLHDNRGNGGDLHLLPFDGIRSWQAFARDLTKADYRGTWNLELSCNGDAAYREMSYETFTHLAYQRLTRLVTMAQNP